MKKNNQIKLILNYYIKNDFFKKYCYLQVTSNY